MAFSDYSTTPALNVTIGGINVGEGCPPGNMNDATRQLMADGKSLADEVAGITTGMPVAGGAFTGDITRSTQGGYLHYQSTALTDGRVYVLPEGTALPTPAEGVLVFFYA